MWVYGKRLQLPVKITQTCPKTAFLIIDQFGGPDGELTVSMRRLFQHYTVSYKEAGGLLTDTGTEELTHLEMIYAIIYRLTRNLTPEQAKIAGPDAYYIDHTAALWSTAAAGAPFDACELQSKGDVITDLHEDLVVKQKTRTAYDSLVRIIRNPEVREPLKSLRAREVVYLQRSGEALEKIKFKLDKKNLYYFDPEFDKRFIQNQK